MKSHEDIMELRKKKILSMIPEDVNTVLDIGSRHSIFKDYETKTVDFVKDADLRQDLNLNQKLKLKDNSFDLVVLNQILEHLSYVEEIIEESKRVSSKYIIVGLPNELIYTARIKFLFGSSSSSIAGYYRHGHKHFFTIKTIEKFIKRFYGGYVEKCYFGHHLMTPIIPVLLNDLLASHLPGLFAKEVYYLLKPKKVKNLK